MPVHCSDVMQPVVLVAALAAAAELIRRHLRCCTRCIPAGAMRHDRCMRDLLFAGRLRDQARASHDPVHETVCGLCAKEHKNHLRRTQAGGALGVLLEDRLHGLKHLLDGLQELRLVRVAGLDGVEQRLHILALEGGGLRGQDKAEASDPIAIIWGRPGCSALIVKSAPPQPARCIMIPGTLPRGPAEGKYRVRDPRACLSPN